MAKPCNYAFTPSGEKVYENDKRELHIWPVSDVESEDRWDCFSALRMGKKRAGRLLDGELHDDLPWRQTGERP
jgi:hypothetical protein